MTLYRWPERTAQARRLTKDQILTRAKMAGVRVNAKLRAQLTDDITRIGTTHLLSTRNINLPARDGIEDVLVIGITQKRDNTPEAVIKLIDRTLPRASLFECTRPDGMTRMLCTHKRPSETDGTRWVNDGTYLYGEWTEGNERMQMPRALDLAALYAAILRGLLSHPAQDGESVADHLSRCRAISALDRELERLNKLVAKERQMNRRVELNDALKTARRSRADLTNGEET
ncbi:MAG: DUF4391 domain-containing protein [Litorimonas sp.]